MTHRETHRSHRGNWLRAAVMGANDGLISTSSLVVGVAAANSSAQAVLLAASAGLVAGALSMAAGEYVSVSSQADADTADLDMEQREIDRSPVAEEAELVGIYVSRGLDRNLATQVSAQLMLADALDAHARDELGILHSRRPRPLQAAWASAAAFTIGALPPVIVAALLPVSAIIYVVGATTAVLLVVLGATAARLGGAPAARGSARVLFWGAVAMGLTALVGQLFGALA